MLRNPFLAEQHAQSLHSILKIGDLIVFHAGGHTHTVGKIHLVAAAAHHIGGVRLDGHLVVGAVVAGGHIAVNGGDRAGQRAVGILRQAGDGELAGGADMQQGRSFTGTMAMISRSSFSLATVASAEPALSTMPSL